MKYCKYCGNALDDHDRFCDRCGRTAEKMQREEITGLRERKPEMKVCYGRWDTFCCQMAYFGTMFWMPLLLTHKSRRSRFCANQGLWTLLLAFACMTGLKLLRWICFAAAGGALGILGGGIYSLTFMLILFFMIYLVAHCIQSARALHRGEDPDPFLFFEEKAIIRYREDRM